MIASKIVRIYGVILVCVGVVSIILTVMVYLGVPVYRALPDGLHVHCSDYFKFQGQKGFRMQQATDPDPNPAFFPTQETFIQQCIKDHGVYPNQ